MRRFNIPNLASKTAARGEIGAEDVKLLRDNLLNGEEIWPHEARAMFDLLQKRLPACAEWGAFFIEAMAHYVVDELEPRGALDEKNARFVSAMLRRDQDNWDAVDLGLVVAILGRAGEAPVSLQQFLLEMTQQVQLAGKPWVHAPRHDAEKAVVGAANTVVALPQAGQSGETVGDPAIRAA